MAEFSYNVKQKLIYKWGFHINKRMIRNCGCCGECGHFNRKKAPCPNKELIKKKKERKRLEKEEKKRLRPRNAGGTVKTRVTSTRHGFSNSVSKHGPPVTTEDLDHRDNQSWYRSGCRLCQWCKKRQATCKDHIYACVSQKFHIYGLTNVLNEMDSCKSCNSRKGGKAIEEWIKVLPKLDWTHDQIKDFRKWTIDYSSKLTHSDEMVQYIEKQFLVINKFHEILEYCAQENEDVALWVIFPKAIPTF
jgi:hypothetical protein